MSDNKEQDQDSYYQFRPNNENNDNNDNNEDTEHKKEPATYALKRLAGFLIRSGWSIVSQYVLDDTICFIKIKYIGLSEPVMIYFPSKYQIIPDESYSPIVEINSEEISEEDRLNWMNGKNEESEIQIDEDFKPLEVNVNNKRELIGFTTQLQRWKGCVSRSKWKLCILSEGNLVYINRHNEVDSFTFKNGTNIVEHVVDPKGQKYLIRNELLFVTDLPSFYDRLENTCDDITVLQLLFYNAINRIHAKQVDFIRDNLKNNNIVAHLNSSIKLKNDLFLLLQNCRENFSKAYRKYCEGLKKKKEEKDHEFEKIKNISESSSILLCSVQKRFHDLFVSQDLIYNESYRLLKAVETWFSLLPNITGKK